MRGVAARGRRAARRGRAAQGDAVGGRAQAAGRPRALLVQLRVLPRADGLLRVLLPTQGLKAVSRMS